MTLSSPFLRRQESRGGGAWTPAPESGYGAGYAGVDWTCSDHSLRNYKMIDTEHYTYRVTWSTEDNEFLGLCAEFPLLSWLAPSQEEAFTGIRQLVADSVEDMAANSERP